MSVSLFPPPPSLYSSIYLSLSFTLFLALTLSLHPCIWGAAKHVPKSNAGASSDCTQHPQILPNTHHPRLPPFTICSLITAEVFSYKISKAMTKQAAH